MSNLFIALRIELKMLLNRHFLDNIILNMEITINGQKKELACGLTLKMLLAELGYANKKVAIEVNQKIISRSQLNNRLVVDGDRIEIIQAIGGG